MTYETLIPYGYCKSPNNIHSLPGNEWYAMGPNTPTVKHGHELRVINGKLSVWATKYYNRPDGSGFNFHISGVVESFDSMDQFVKWCETNGRISEAGLPAYLWGD